MISHGTTKEGLQYIIMYKYGPSLKMMLRRTKLKRFSIKTAIQIGIQLIDRLKDLHNFGYLHLDLKPDNILLGSSNRTRVDSSNIVLIDYGISKRYLTDEGVHIKEADGVAFSGNLLFASKNTFLEKEQSRRDDFISLAYFVVFLVNGEINWLGNLRHQD